MGQKSCLLTAITLLVFGCGQLLRQNLQEGGSAKGLSAIKWPVPNAKTAQAALLQICSIALPFYAAFKVGGFLVAFALLLSSASGMPNLVGVDPRAAAPERYSRKTLTITLLVVVTLLSFFGLNRAWDSSPSLGYAALMISVFVLSPPFPSVRRQGPIPEPGLVAESISQDTKASDTAQSAVSVTTDAPLALVSGASLAVLTLILSGGLPLSLFNLVYLLVPSGLFAASLMVSFSLGLRSPDKFGLAICTGATGFLCSPHAKDDWLVIFTARGILAVMSYFAARIDDRRLRLDAHLHTHGHHRHSSHSHGATESSPVTKWLLNRSEPYPLIHSILKEKDSRSIFYFMW